MKLSHLFSFVFISLLMTACQNLSGSLKVVDVYRTDQSRQCENNSGISLNAMQQKLGSIRVYSARKDNLQGVMFPAVCGGETGQVNVYTIDADNVQLAKLRGFEIFRQPEYLGEQQYKISE